MAMMKHSHVIRTLSGSATCLLLGVTSLKKLRLRLTVVADCPAGAGQPGPRGRGPVGAAAEGRARHRHHHARRPPVPARHQVTDYLLRMLMGLCAFGSTQQGDACIDRLMPDDVVLRVRTVDIEEGARIAGKVRSLSGSWRRYLIQTYRHNVAASFLLLASADTACHVLLFPPGADQGLLVRVLGRCDV